MFYDCYDCNYYYLFKWLGMSLITSKFEPVFRVTKWSQSAQDFPSLLRIFPVFALKVLYQGTPLSPRQTEMVGHPSNVTYKQCGR